MGERRAVLVGVEHYGDGLDDLPATRRDIALVGESLEHSGYEVEELTIEGVGRAGADSLRDQLSEFCAESQPDDVYVIYFSGHGLAVDGRDYLVPPGVGREEAASNETLRVETDFEQFVSGGLVVLIVDACRDETITKGGTGLGYQPIGGATFIRFFGCSRGEVCQVDGAGEGEPASVFAKALADTLLQGEAETLRAVQEGTIDRCRPKPGSALKRQTPRLSHGETGPDILAALDRRIFDAPVRSTIWRQFEPSLLHCLLITSEYEWRRFRDDRLESLVTVATQGRAGRQIWRPFQRYWAGRRLARGGSRAIDGDFREIITATFSARTVFDQSVFPEVVRGLVEADLVIFDVTDFEPGVMVLMGIRAASRRGVSICTHGRGWKQLDAIDVPFNLADLSLNSHAENEEKPETSQEALDALVKRAELGFEQMARQPAYQDLPAYNALRDLGPLYEASSTVPVTERVLALAPYRDTYDWTFVKNALEGHLEDRHHDTEVLRLIDGAGAQLVSQSLYEQIRRVAGCIVDWSEFSPSTFFELGVRLASSEWGAVQMVDARYLSGGEKAEGWRHFSTQVARMAALFDPVEYTAGGDDAPLAEVARVLVEQNPALERAEPTADSPISVHRIVSSAVQRVEEAQAWPSHVLRDAADALHHPNQDMMAAPQLLFRSGDDNGDQPVKRDAEEAAREYRFAAWLYLHHRLDAGGSDASPDLRSLHRRLGNELANSLFDAGQVDAGDSVLQHLAEAEVDPVEAAKVQRKRADAFRKAGRHDEAGDAIRAGVGFLEDATNRLEASEAATEAEKAEAWGALGGMRARLGENLGEALAAYQRGAEIERDAELPSTYNRLNVIKFELRTSERTLTQAKPDIRELAQEIERKLRDDPRLGDSGWAWADLGDCWALAGDRGAARGAYQTFIERAPTASPGTALNSLVELAKHLKPDEAAEVRRAVEALEEELT